METSKTNEARRPRRTDMNANHPRPSSSVHRPASRARRDLLAAAAIVLSGLAPVHAQSTKPVSLMVPYPAGGPSDYVARQIQNDFQKHLGQTVIVDNLGGASGTIAAQKVLSFPADGQNLLLTTPIEVFMGPLAIPSVKYKAENFKLAHLMATTPIVLIAHKGVPANNIDEFLAWAKTRNVSYGSTGPGSLYHLMGEKLAAQTGIKALHVPYKGGNQLMVDLVGGQVDVAFFALAGPVPAMIKEGRVRAIGITTAKPFAAFPELSPIAANQQLSDFLMDIWVGIAVATATPDATVTRINEAMTKTMGNPAIRKNLEDAGNTIAPSMSNAELARFYAAQTTRYQDLSRSVKLQPQ
jgi:tripartite-type tricarboxylate transporter receptor subunit TctC